jgi:hypothetical protein
MVGGLSMSNPDGKYKTEVEQELDNAQAIANRLRRDEAARLRIFLMGCGISLLFGFIAGHIQ